MSYDIFVFKLYTKSNINHFLLFLKLISRIAVVCWSFCRPNSPKKHWKRWLLPVSVVHKLRECVQTHGVWVWFSSLFRTKVCNHSSYSHKFYRECRRVVHGWSICQCSLGWSTTVFIPLPLCTWIPSQKTQESRASQRYSTHTHWQTSATDRYSTASAYWFPTGCLQKNWSASSISSRSARMTLYPARSRGCQPPRLYVCRAGDWGTLWSVRVLPGSRI